MAIRKTAKGFALASKRGVPERLAVWLDDPAFGPLTRIGTLSRSGLESVRFSYDKDWLAHPIAFQLDPDLSLNAGDFFPKDSNFGIFMDSCPDRWGQVLMKRRELVQAKEEARTKRELRAWEFLLGVQDFTRMGALRFSDADEVNNPTFLANEARAAPPLTQLAELQAIALELSRKKLDDLSKLEQWLRVLVAPGASLGGARPKASLAKLDNSLWIAKFPAADDDQDVAMREKLVHDLAKACGIDVPASQVNRIGHGYHTFLVQRFDRNEGQRRFFTSAMTLLNKTDKDEASYLDLAEFISTQGSPQHIADDLRQMFRRVAFNVAIGNRDDHLRNHGFIRKPEGWLLSPAYDMTPSSKKDSHILTLDESSPTPDLGTVLATASFYRLTPPQARDIVSSVLQELRGWEHRAKALGLSGEDLEELKGLFLLDL